MEGLIRKGLFLPSLEEMYVTPQLATVEGVFSVIKAPFALP